MKYKLNSFAIDSFVKRLSINSILSLMLVMVFLSTNMSSVYAQSGDTDTSGSNGNSCVTLDNNLRYRMRDVSVNNEVSDLQDYLIAEGYLSGTTTGYFGVATLKAVKSFQSQNGLISSGYVGPVTRAKIKSMSCDTANHYDGNTSSLNNPTVITPSIPGMINVTYYYLNSNKDRCGTGTFVGNSGVHVQNGQFVYQQGEYKTEAECKSANGLTSNPSGIMCTMEARMCPDGSTMYRDSNCGWHEEMCRDQSNTLKVNISSIAAVPNPSYYGASDVTLFNMTLTGTNFNQISYLQEEHLVDGQQSITRSSFTSATDNQIGFNMKICQGCKYTSTFNAVDKNGNKSNLMQILIDNTTPSKKISISSATLKEYDANNINLMIYGSGFKNGTEIRVGNNCAAGSVYSLSSNSDTETSASFDKAYLLGCMTPGTYANVYIAGNGTDNSNVYSVYVPMMSIKPIASIKAQSGVLGVTLSNGMIDYQSARDINYNNSHALNYVDIVKGQYQSIEVKYSCGAYLNTDMTLKDNYALSGDFMTSEGTRSFGCPSSTRLMKGGADIMTVANINKDNDKLTYIVNYYEGWRDSSSNRKDEPLGNLDFYGVSSDGSRVYLKTVTFIHSMKG